MLLGRGGAAVVVAGTQDSIQSREARSPQFLSRRFVGGSVRGLSRDSVSLFALCGFLLLVCAAGAMAQDSPRRAFLGPDGQLLPFSTDEEVLAFLADAEVLSMDPIPVGVTNPRKVLLEQGGVRSHAVFRVVDEIHEETRLSDGRLRQRLRDSAVLEVAAYKLSIMLGMTTVPPTAVRRIGREQGTLQLWIENTMTETDRRLSDSGPSNLLGLSRDIQKMRAFDILVGNDDRNPGNILYERDSWRLWMIDHTRAFQAFYGEPDFSELHWCERALWERLQSLERREVEAELDEYLSDHEIDTMFERRDALVAHIRRLIDDRGSGAVLY